jgi:sterol 3beta-glucosyltransferase
MATRTFASRARSVYPPHCNTSLQYGGETVRIAILCNDTRGGVQPYVALALGLSAAGHAVRAVAPGDLAWMFRERGIATTPLSGSIEAVLRASGGAAERGTLSAMRPAAREMPQIMGAWTRTTLEACEGVDMITGGVGGMVIGLSVAEKLGRPFVEAHLQPIGAPTGAYPGVLLPGVPRWLGAWGRRMSHHLSELGVWMPFRSVMQTTRESVLGLRGRPTANAGQPVLYGFSRHVVPLAEVGRRQRHVTGYWFSGEAMAFQPSPALTSFFAHDEPVVSLGFGSMASEKPEAVTALVLDAVEQARVRAVLLSGWGGLAKSAASERVHVAEALPHDWLFPRVAAVVHHGGAGTTGAALRAGTPAVVVPFTMDQPFWGARVEVLGVGPTPIPRARLTAKKLADAMRRAIDDPHMRARADALGAAIREEDGVAAAVAIFSRLAA